MIKLNTEVSNILTRVPKTFITCDECNSVEWFFSICPIECASCGAIFPRDVVYKNTDYRLKYHMMEEV